MYVIQILIVKVATETVESCTNSIIFATGVVFFNACLATAEFSMNLLWQASQCSFILVSSLLLGVTNVYRPFHN